MPSKFVKNPNELSDRQERRRIEFLRRNVQNENVARESSSSSTSSAASNVFDLDIPVEPFMDNGIDDLEELHDERQSDDDSDAESSDRATVSSHEQDFDDDDDDVRNMILEDNELPEDGDDSDGSNLNEDHNVNMQEDIATISKRKVKNAFLSAGLTHTQGNIILKTLREYPFQYLHLPKDSRTILNTPAFVASRFVHETAGGEYLHIGFQDGLQKKLSIIPREQLPPKIIVDLSTDGGRLDKGGKWQFWPHQYRIINIPDKRPMIAGVFKGRHKPSNPFDFFEMFFQEINEVIGNGGIEIGGRTIPLQIRCFIADAPARAMILNHYGHTSSRACSKCKVEGHRCDVEGYRNTMIFPGTRHPPRTNEEYRNITDDDHHKGHSPLSQIPIDLVTRVPFECMHLIYLGNVKKVFEAHVAGKYICRRLSGRQLNILDARMNTLSDYCPREFARRPREITAYSNFKAVEFRQLLLYSCVVILKDIFSEEYYQHFLILHCVIRLLVSESTTPVMLDFCQQSLEMYVSMCVTLYGEPFLSYNVHGLLHIVEDVRNLGGLETFSAFCYENNMPQFPKFLRKPDLSLQQYYKRMLERSEFSNDPINGEDLIQQSHVHAEGPLLDLEAQNCTQFKKIVIGKYTFAADLRDNCFVSNNKRICLIENIVLVEENILFIARHFRDVQQLYDVGLTSQSVGVYHCSNLSPESNIVPLTDVKVKCYRMPKWNEAEGLEENIVQNEWVCVTHLESLSLPRN